ncbi:MAG: MMPL family transporter [Candidatus Omnitrophica bacterium]|nr:MMPL family transporter [Candidatus Omnitrophota bacterium]
MSANYLSKINDLVKTHKKLIIGLLGLVILACLIGLKFIKYNNNIELMLPADSQVQQSMRFLRESNFSDKLVISLKLNGQKHSTDDLILATDKLINSIDSPLVKQVIGSVSSANFMQEMIFFLQYSPQLLGTESLIKLKNLLQPPGIKERLSFIYRQSLTPGSSLLMPFLRADPLNLSSEILGNIGKLSQSSGYDITINNGHFVSEDGRTTMIIIKTSVLLTDGFGSRKIVSYLQEKLRGIPDFISADIIAGHMHTVKNEDLIKKDIWFTSVIAALGFLLLFLFIFRDWRSIIIFAMPLGAVLISTGVAFLIFKNLSYFVIGLSTVIAGITIDYGIYVYLAVRKAGNSLETLRKIIRPVVFGALTTISVFAVFFFSSVKGYHQLAFFSNFTILLCLGFALFILPHFIKEEAVSPKIHQRRADETGKKFVIGSIPDYLWLISWCILIIIMLGLAARLKFNNDITQFDGAGKEIAKSEEEFHHTWGAKKLPAVFVVSAETLPGAYELNDAVYEAAVKAIGQENFNSLASIWPGMAKRKENLEAWNTFWTQEKIKEFQNMLFEYGQPFNFSDEAFAPFIQQLHTQTSLEMEPKGLVFFEQLKEQFVLKKDGAYQILSFFPDQDEYIAKLSGIKNAYPGTFLVSRKNFSRQISQALSGEFFFLAFLAIFSTLGLTFLLLKNLRLTILAMIPVATALALIAGVTHLAGLALNIPSVIAAMVVVGIVSDYGMFMVYYCKYRYQTGTIIAVTLAAVTTLIGAGVLLFAQHPVLFSIGITLVTGVLSGYLSSLLIIPALYRLWKVKVDVSV